jgi:hypothetical protein
MSVAALSSPTSRAKRREIGIALHPKQAAFIQSTATFKAFVGGRGAGKSRSLVYNRLRRAKRDRLYLVAAPTYKTLHDATMRAFERVAKQLGRLVKPMNKGQDPNAIIRCVDGGTAEVIFRTANDPDNLRGPNLSGVDLDEATYMKRAAFDVAIACLRENGEQGELASFFTPKGKKSWCYRQFQSGLPDTAFFHAKTKENPFLPPGFDERIRRQYSSRLARQELDGETIDTAGGIPLEHLIDCQDEACGWKDDRPTAGKWPELYVGIDVGRRRDRSVIWVDEKIGDVLWGRVCKVLDDVPFQEQFRIASSFIGMTGVVKARVDKGFNPQLAEDLERKFPGKVEGVSLNSARQIELFTLIENAAEKRTMRLPIDDENEIINDFQLVSREDEWNSKPAIETARDETGHADRFWAKALAASAARESESQKVIFARPAFGPRKR